MKRKFFLRGLIVVFLSIILVTGVCERVQGEIADGVVRLHIIANSDSEDDQKTKLLVRDVVIDKQKEIFPDGIPKKLTEEQITKIEHIAKNICGYGVKVEKGRFYFPTKSYENITLPAGEYDAIKVVLGKGEGQNWWCVMYPPLCFTQSAVGSMSEENSEILKKNMSKNAYEFITDESIKVVPALQILEVWGEVKKTAKKWCNN